MAPVSKAYAAVSGPISLLLTYLFMLAIMSIGAKVLKLKLKEFALGFTVIFWVSYLSGSSGSCVHRGDTGQTGGLQDPLVVESHGRGRLYCCPCSPGWLSAISSPGGHSKEATRPEWYIKTAIVILGGISRRAGGGGHQAGQGRHVPWTAPSSRPT